MAASLAAGSVPPLLYEGGPHTAAINSGHFNVSCCCSAQKSYTLGADLALSPCMHESCVKTLQCMFFYARHGALISCGLCAARGRARTGRVSEQDAPWASVRRADTLSSPRDAGDVRPQTACSARHATSRTVARVATQADACCGAHCNQPLWCIDTSPGASKGTSLS